MRRLPAVVVLLLALAGTGSARATVTEMGSAGALQPGGAAFWSGPAVAHSGSGTSGLLPRPNPPGAGAWQCDLAEYECFAYELTVAAGGERLRVAIDHPDAREA